MTALAPTLSTRLFPRTAGWLRDLLLILAGSLLVALCAQVQIPLPFSPVPITGQTFAVLLVGAALGSKRGAAALTAYLFEGALGLPFFAGGTSGFRVLSGATAGYLIGFVAAAYVIGLLAERGLERSVRTSLLPFLVGTIIIYACGVAWLTVLFGFQKAIALGLLPFLIGDALKLIAAALALPAAWRLVGQPNTGHRSG
jgi:biotin transport system substrate-specific component